VTAQENRDAGSTATLREHRAMFSNVTQVSPSRESIKTETQQIGLAVLPSYSQSTIAD